LFGEREATAKSSTSLRSSLTLVGAALFAKAHAMPEAPINLSQQTPQTVLISDSQRTGKGLAVNRSPRVAAAVAAATVGIVFAPAVPALAHPHAPGKPASPGMSNGSSTNPNSRPNVGPPRNGPKTPRGGIFDDIKDRFVNFFTNRVHPPFHG
jgi:hypothetical protein